LSLAVALARAQALGAFVGPVHRRAGAAAGPLQGWTVSLKDNLDLAGDCVGLGTERYARRRASTTATAVQRLLDAGAQLLGRTQMVALAYGGWGLNPALGTPRNPWDAEVARVPGGSSSGAAVAVAVRAVRAALGTDTAGSVRLPAALCGVTGFKPSPGTVPMDGVFPLARSFEVVGPLALSAADCACLHQVMSGQPLPPARPRGRLAVLDPASWPVPVQPAVHQAWLQARAVFEADGVPTDSLRAPFELTTLTQHAGELIAAEAWQVHRLAFEAEPGSFGPELNRRMAAARDLSPATVAAAQAGRLLATAAFDPWLQGHDALLLPCVPVSAPAISEVSESGSVLGHFTRWVNHVGGCAISLPAGLDEHGLPLAVQLVARAGQDAVLLALAQRFQQLTRWHLLAPRLDWLQP
jgi:aspartyl-tRNA(Asn)/glutamyl-tRNA(Gln) amidotransferase subunit A